MLRLFSLFIAFSLIAATMNDAVILGASSQSVLMMIDSSARGNLIVNTFNAAVLPHAASSLYPEFIFQTNIPANLKNLYGSYSYIVNGRIPFVQSITQTPNNTLLIITYKGQNPYNTQYVVVPPEQISELIYVPLLLNEPRTEKPFSSSFSSGFIPYYAVDPGERTADIIPAVNQLLITPFAAGQSQVWMQTGVTGPFSALNSSGTPGLIQNILSITQIMAGLIQVNFRPLNWPTEEQIILAPEQVELILYIPNPFNPSVHR